MVTATPTYFTIIIFKYPHDLSPSNHNKKQNTISPTFPKDGITCVELIGPPFHDLCVNNKKQRKSLNLPNSKDHQP